MRKYIIFIIFVFIASMHIWAQDSTKEIIPNKNQPKSVWIDKTSASKTNKMLMTDSLMSSFKPNPSKAVLFALIPGGGQVYNKKYWKLPLIYGGFIGMAYLISWNGKYYNQYSAAYNASMSTDPMSPQNQAIWAPFLPPGTNPNTLSPTDLSFYQASFKRKQDFYRRDRDLSIIGAVAIYAASIVDAYVDAQLFDFDISPDLSMNVSPTLMGTTPGSMSQTLGLQCSINF